MVRNTIGCLRSSEIFMHGVRAVEPATTKFLWGPDPGLTRDRQLCPDQPLSWLIPFLHLSVSSDSRWKGRMLPIRRQFPGKFNFVAYKIRRLLCARVGRSYFFSGQHYWLFNDARMHAERGYPRPIGPHWFGCGSQQASSQHDYVSPSSSVPPHLSAAAATALLLTTLAPYLSYSKPF